MNAMQDITNAAPQSAAREFGAVNWLGLWTLYKKEVHRFMRVGPQTLLAPMISNLLFMTVFVVAFAERGTAGTSSEFMAFLAPGLVIMGILTNASSNSSSSIMTGKLMGSINDVLMPPLSHTELAVGYIGGAITRGLIVGISTAAGLWLFTPLVPVKIWPVLYFSLSAAASLAMIGILAGIWAEKFDQLAVVNQFIIMPLSMLSGTFYHIQSLPDTLYKISLFNPLFYYIDGFRYGFLGVSDGDIKTGVIMAAILNTVLFIVVLRVLKSGWRLKS